MPPKARKGPEAHASATPVGTVAKGNDGNMWVVTATANGIKRWVRHAAGTVAATKVAGPVPPRPKRPMSMKDIAKIADPKAKRNAWAAHTRWLNRVTKWERDNGVETAYDRMLAKRAAEAAKSRPVVKDVVPKKGSKEYLTHDNGGRSFLVRYNKSEFTVFEPDREAETAFYGEIENNQSTASWVAGIFTGANRKSWDDFDKRQKALFTIPVLTSKYKRVFVGASHTEEIEDGKIPGGNTMLFEIEGGRYVCVSQDVASFKPPERIESYESPVHGSDVPYPYAVGAKANYLILERVTVPHSDLQSPDQDPYDVAYFRDVEHNPTRRKKATAYAKAHPLPGYKVIRQRRI